MTGVGRGGGEGDLTGERRSERENAGVLKRFNYSANVKKASAKFALLLALIGLVSDMHAQQDESDRKFFAETKAKAESGNADAQLELARCYKNGTGVATNEVEALNWCRKAAEQGLALAQNNLGTCYEKGEGVKSDMAEAVKWYRRAADQGLAKAQCNLGLCYIVGKGVPQSDGEAAKWLGRSAERGNALAQLNIGVCYINGEGVAKNKIEAHKWMSLAKAQGRADVTKFLADLERDMSQQQITEAQKRAREFKPKPEN